MLWLPYQRDLVKVELRQVLRFAAERDYVQVHTDQRSYLVRATLGDIEQLVCGPDFVRIHRSTIVATIDIVALRHCRAGAWAAVHRDGSLSPIGRSFLAPVRAVLGVGDRGHVGIRSHI